MNLPRLTATICLSCFCTLSASADVLYETYFDEFTAGTDNWSGTNGWIATISGQALHGIDDNIVPGLGNSAFLGLADPDDSQSKEISDEVVSVFRPIGFAPVTEGKPIVEFEALIGIAASQDVPGTPQDESGIADRFLISFYNNSAQLLASVIYDNRAATYGLWRNNGGTNGSFDTGIEFVSETPQFLFVTINFENNTWSASLDGVPVFTNAQFTATGRTRDLGLIAAELRITSRMSRFNGGQPITVWKPANNWMIIDDWIVSAKSRPTATLTEPFLISKVERTAENKIELTYPADEGCIYRVEYSTDLKTWTELLDSPVSANESDPVAKHTDDAPAEEARYYRILREAGD